ncbi:hypothetical protein [Campylobacter helveticus]|uniref:hypothetical protein n=1 Tax=Campylobacter helveticus TaxID=28898 RepID=UPI001117A165|nr:hypothetical protein [Campylobacter helveticus]TNH33868.1 hypothetical protein FDW46_05515 [Campylobacter helveticus]TNH36386.1 hypothetical protein FDW45_05660 [Campylobacter helveticus]
MIKTYYKIEDEVTVEELVSFISHEKDFCWSNYANFTLNGYEFTLSRSDYNPLEDDSYAPKLLSFSKKYTYGVKELRNKEGELINIIDECNDLDEVESWLEKNDYVYAPFEKYEHGLIAFRLLTDKYSNLTCRFDSCIGGYLVMKKSDLREFRNVKKLTDKVLQKEFAYWNSLLGSFTNYINGSQYEADIEGNGFYESYFANSLEELCEFILPFLNKQVA